MIRLMDQDGWNKNISRHSHFIRQKAGMQSARYVYFRTLIATDCVKNSHETQYLYVICRNCEKFLHLFSFLADNGILLWIIMMEILHETVIEQR